MTDQPEASATYEVHGIDEEPTLTWATQPTPGGPAPTDPEPEDDEDVPDAD